jgi:hypothetical protein
MCNKGGYTSLTLSLGEDNLDDSIASYITCKTYDETISVINTTKDYDAYREQHLHRQLARDNRGTKRILVVDDEQDINLTLKFINT